MKRQFFLLLLINSCSAYAMNYDMSKMTKTQLTNKLTDFNSYMKQHHPHEFDTKEFGWFIVHLRSMDKNTFENHKKDLLSLITPVDVLEKREFF
jgi:hypothetical protein